MIEEATPQEKLLADCHAEELDVTHRADGTVDIWRAHYQSTCGRGPTLPMAIYSYILHNPASVSREFREKYFIDSAVADCEHDMGWWGKVGLEDMLCHTCGKPIPKKTPVLVQEEVLDA
jgi:hypothetical protein